MPTLNILIAIVQPDATQQIGRDRRRCGARDRRDDRPAAESVRKPLSASAIHGPLQSRSFEGLSPPTSASKSSKSFTSAWPAHTAASPQSGPARRARPPAGPTITPGALRPEPAPESRSDGPCAARSADARAAAPPHEGAPLPVRPQLPQQLDTRQRQRRGRSAPRRTSASASPLGGPRDAEQPIEAAAARQQPTVQLLEPPIASSQRGLAGIRGRPVQLPLTPLGHDPWGIAPVGLGVIMGCMSSTPQILKVRGGGRHGTRGGATWVQTPAEPSGHCGVHRGILYHRTAVSLCVVCRLQRQSC